MKFTTIVTVTNPAFLKIIYSQVIFLCFLPFFFTNYPEKQEEKKTNRKKKYINPESNRGPLDHQSYILPLDWCIRWGITTEIKSNNSLLKAIVCCHMYHILIHRPNCISKLTPASDIWWFFTLLLISKKNAFLHNWEFWGKILIFENSLITTKRQEIQTIYLKKISWHIYSLIS